METDNNCSLSKGQKIALWIAFVWVLFCLLGAFGNSWYILIVVCITLLATILCLFNRKLDAKYAWGIFAVSVILPFVMIGTLANLEDDNVKQETIKEDHPKETIKSEKTEKTTKEQTGKAPQQQLSSKEKEIADAGCKRGTMFGMAADDNEELKSMLDMAEYVDGMDDKIEKIFGEMAGNDYDNEYGAPTNAEQVKLKKLFIDNFIKSMNETMEAMDKLKK